MALLPALRVVTLPFISKWDLRLQKKSTGLGEFSGATWGRTTTLPFRALLKVFRCTGLTKENFYLLVLASSR